MRFAQLHPTIRIRIISLFMTKLVSAMVLPFMGVYFAERLSPFLAGILLFISLLAGIASSFYGGYVADAVGRKRTLAVAEIMQGIAFAGMAFANSAWFTSPWVTYAALLIQSVSAGLMMPASDAMLVDVSTKENRRWMYSINYWSLNLSTAVGSLTGGLFFVTNHFHLFLAMVLVSILNLLLLLFFIHDTYRPTPSPKKDLNPFKKMAMNYAVVARDRTFALYWLAGLLVLSLSFQIPNYITIRLQEEFTPLSLRLFGHTLTLDGVFVGGGIRTLNTILIVAGAFAAAWMVKRMSNRIALFVGVFLHVLGHALLGFVNDLAVLALSVLLLSLGELIYVPVKQSILAEIAPDNLRSTYMALNGMVFQGARLSGALGITVGAFLSPGVMSTLFLLAGFSGLFLFQRVLDRLTPAPSAHAEKGGG